jgi:hypothetical protein
VTAAHHIAEAEQWLKSSDEVWREGSPEGALLEAQTALVHAVMAAARELADLRALLGGVRDEIRGLR